MLEISFTHFPVLETERLQLRQLTLHDSAALFALRSDPQIMQFIGRPIATSEQDAIDLIETITSNLNNNNGITWGIAIKGEKDVIGSVGFHRIVKEHYRAEIGYMLHSGYQRKGLMQEAITAAVQYAFNHMGLHSIEANIDPTNAASRGVLEKCGFVQEAYFKESFFFDGKFLDAAVFSLVNSGHSVAEG